LKAIYPGYVFVRTKNQAKKIPADAVYLLTGYHPDVSLLDSCGVKYNSESLEPIIDLESLESNLPGLYLAGSIIAGRNANKIFIENSREHGEKILTHIESKFKMV
jgi:thioredoxin reductase (NADPH)